jgi:hypothetical protein
MKVTKFTSSGLRVDRSRFKTLLEIMTVLKSVSLALGHPVYACMSSMI